MADPSSPSSLFSFSPTSPKSEQKKTHRPKGNFGDRKKLVDSFLARQKQTKRSFVDHLRKISENEEDDEAANNEGFSMNTEEERSERRERLERERRERERERYKNQLMVFEKMTQLPEDPEEWVMKPCPEGERCLVVVHKKKTRAYRMDGTLLYQFYTGLPKGSVFDCIAHLPSKNYYVLDLMAWRGDSYYDCPVDFRQFFLCSKLEEFEAGQKTHKNKYPLLALPCFGCDEKGVGEALGMEGASNILFYQKEGFYIFEEVSPLVGVMGVEEMKKMISN